MLRRVAPLPSRRQPGFKCCQKFKESQHMNRSYRQTTRPETQRISTPPSSSTALCPADYRPKMQLALQSTSSVFHLTMADLIFCINETLLDCHSLPAKLKVMGAVSLDERAQLVLLSMTPTATLHPSGPEDKTPRAASWLPPQELGHPAIFTSRREQGGPQRQDSQAASPSSTVSCCPLRSEAIPPPPPAA